MKYNKMIKSYQEFKNDVLLVEGGNITFNDVSAERIDLKQINRDEIVPKLKNLIININKKFRDEFKENLWSKTLIDSGKFLSGSAFHFFNTTDIPSDKFTKFKSSVGDIDTQVDKNKTKEIEIFLNNNLLKEIGTSTLLGFKKTFEQFITLWKFKLDKDRELNIQIDLELVEYENEEPTAWANFSHSSHWDDITKKIKGVFHKWLLRSISDKDNISFVERMKTKDKVISSNIFSFSVSNGLREKYAPVLDDEGKQVISTEHNLPVYKSVPTSTSIYVTQLDIIFKSLIGVEPKRNDLELFGSYIGLMKLIKKYFTETQIRNTVNRFADLLFDVKAQGLYKNEPEKDREEKLIAFELLCKNFSINISEYHDMIETYYENYK